MSDIPLTFFSGESINPLAFPYMTSPPAHFYRRKERRGGRRGGDKGARKPIET